MIKINLLPQSERPKAVTKAPLIVVATVIIVGLIVFIMYTYQSRRINSAKIDIDVLQKKKAELDPQVQDYQNQIEALERKDKAISELSGQERFLWSKKLNELATLVPDKVKFTHVYMTTNDKKNYLKLEGVTYSKNGEERVELIAKLMDALKSKGFYYKPNGDPNFGEVEFVQAIAADEAKEKQTGYLIDNFVIQMEIQKVLTMLFLQMMMR